MTTKKWLWILMIVLVIGIIATTTICLTRCSRKDDQNNHIQSDPRDTAIILTADSTVINPDKHYNADVQDGKSGQTYVFKSKANEHEYDVYVLQAETETLVDSSKYTLKLYDKDYNEISMVYNANEHSITLADNTTWWDAFYDEQDVYFAITLNEDASFRLELRRLFA